MTEKMTAEYADSQRLDARIALHRKYTPHGQDMLDVIWQHYDFIAGETVLDVGCGAGQFWLHPDARCDGIKLSLLDQSPGMLETAQENLEHTGLVVSAETGVAEALHHDTNSFDHVIAHFMLYHVGDPAKALAHFARIARRQVGIVLLRSDSMSRVFSALNQVDPQLDVPTNDADQYHADIAEPDIHAAFAGVSRVDYDYTMEVTEASDLVSYVRSSAWTDRLPETFWPKLQAVFQEEINREGCYRVTKSCVLFLCRP